MDSGLSVEDVEELLRDPFLVDLILPHENSLPAPPRPLVNPLTLSVVRQVIAAERPEDVIPSVCNDPSLTGVTSEVANYYLHKVTAMDARPLYKPSTPEGLAKRLHKKRIMCRPSLPLAVLCTQPGDEHAQQFGVFVMDVALAQAGPGSRRHCLKGTYRSHHVGMPVILEYEGWAWGLGVVADTALRRDDVICEAVALLATIHGDDRISLVPDALPRWRHGTLACQGDALVPNLTHALRHTPNEAALIPFHMLCARSPIPDLKDRMHHGTDFHVTFDD